ncbi:hypothetical protein N9Y42_01745 [Mariniblastus sp.]|nr:hypothetical protein [Mariniblastus sp.]
MSREPTQFELWLETEVGDPKDQPANRSHENFCNISVTMLDGRRYALNVWTFDFLPLARYPWPHEINDDAQQVDYLLPPDLFVKSLDRPVIESIISKLIEADEMKEAWLVNECE